MRKAVTSGMLFTILIIVLLIIFLIISYVVGVGFIKNAISKLIPIS
jgi:hypothetical protein